MKDIFTAPFVQEMMKTTANMYRLGWDERNGGNISFMLEEEIVAEYLDLNNVIREIPTGFDATELIGKIFIVTGTGKYFKNVEVDPETNLGIIRIAKDGTTAELLWGWSDGGKFTSEFPAHMMSHISRLAVDPTHRIVMHSHPTYTIAMNTVCSTDEKEFTHKLWQSNTEAVVVFPDGVTEVPADLPVLHASRIGRIHTLIMRMNAEEAGNLLVKYSPLLVDAVPLTLEEIFIYELGGTDYAVKDIVL